MPTFLPVCQSSIWVLYSLTLHVAGKGAEGNWDANRCTGRWLCWSWVVFSFFHQGMLSLYYVQHPLSLYYLFMCLFGFKKRNSISGFLTMIHLKPRPIWAIVSPILVLVNVYDCFPLEVAQYLIFDFYWPKKKINK